MYVPKSKGISVMLLILWIVTSSSFPSIMAQQEADNEEITPSPESVNGIESVGYSSIEYDTNGTDTETYLNPVLNLTSTSEEISTRSTSSPTQTSSSSWGFLTTRRPNSSVIFPSISSYPTENQLQSSITSPPNSDIDTWVSGSDSNTGFLEDTNNNDFGADRESRYKHPFAYDQLLSEMYRVVVEMKQIRADMNKQHAKALSYMKAVDNRVTKIVKENLVALVATDEATGQRIDKVKAEAEAKLGEFRNRVQDQFNAAQEDRRKLSKNLEDLKTAVERNKGLSNMQANWLKNRYEDLFGQTQVLIQKNFDMSKNLAGIAIKNGNGQV